MNLHSDLIILGAGMAGASLAAALAGERTVRLIETEDQPGRHATGRSAAMFFESYGNAAIRALTRASRAFLLRPPVGFAEVTLMTRRDGMIVADAAGLPLLDAWMSVPPDPDQQRLDAAQALARVPVLRPEAVAGAVLDRSGHDIDVAALHQGFLRAARRAGGETVLDAGEVVAERRGGLWHVHTRAGRFTAPVLVNATGAWADAVALQAGVQPVGLQPMRRSALIIAAPEGHDSRDWPMVIGVHEDCYFKPDAGHLLLSPANEDPMPPCDVVPEELDVALAVDRYEALTTHKVARVLHRWAGLRSFVADRTPVLGFDDQAEGFFWLAGQGGYGIQTAPAMARAAAALVCGRPLPEDLLAQGVRAEDLSPARPALRRKATMPG